MQFSRPIFWVLFLLFLSNHIFAQNSKTPKEKEKNLYPETRLRISIPLSIETNTDLNPQKIKISEDTSPFAVASIAKPNQSISYGLVLDTSGSMRTNIVPLKIVAFSLINHLRGNDDLMMEMLKAEGELLHPLSVDKGSLTKSLSDLYTGGGTSLFDGIIAAADYIQENSKNPRQVLIVITDGGEKNSLAKVDQVASVLAADNVSLFVIQINTPQDGYDNPSKKKIEQLAALVKMSGGMILEYTPPKKIIASEIENYIKQATELTLPMIEQLKSKYQLSYFSTNNKFDGKARQVKIEWQDGEGKTTTQDFSYVVPKK